MSTASGARSRKCAAAVAKGPNMPAHSSVTAGVCPVPAPQRLPVPAQKCSSVPLAWLVATLHGRAVTSGPGPADNSAQR
eukprot:15339286-Alexandrium_andersonii.AAC.1